jgi:hypothetical protein
MTARRPTNSAVTLHVERLSLHGVSRDDGQRIASAFTAALERLIAREGLPGTVAATDAAAPRPLELRLGRDHRPETVGRRLAELVYRSLVS